MKVELTELQVVNLMKDKHLELDLGKSFSLVYLRLRSWNETQFCVDFEVYLANNDKIKDWVAIDKCDFKTIPIKCAIENWFADFMENPLFKNYICNENREN